MFNFEVLVMDTNQMGGRQLVQTNNQLGAGDHNRGGMIPHMFLGHSPKAQQGDPAITTKSGRSRPTVTVHHNHES